MADVTGGGPGANEVHKDRTLFKVQKLRAIRERSRERKNWRFYDGTDYGQWDEQSVRLLLQEGRPPHTFNFIETKVDTLVGSILTDEYQLNFETELGEKNNDAIMLNELFMEDKDLCNFDYEMLQVIRGGFVYRGYLQMHVDRSKDPRGRIAWRYISPDRVQVDVDWKTNNINDCKWVFIHAWMSPAEIKAKYKVKSDAIDAAIAMWESVKDESLQETELDKVFDRSEEFYDRLNGLFLVIEKYSLKETRKIKLWDPMLGQFLPEQDGEDADLLHKMAALQGRRLEKLPCTYKECYVHTFAPGISLTLSLQDDRTELQTGGYPLFAYSSNMVNGHPNTMVDQLKDAQEAYNKRISTATHILMTNANNVLLIEEGAVNGDEALADRIGRERNRPGAYFLVEDGTNSQAKIKHLDKAAPPSDFLEAASQVLEMAQQLSPAVPAVQSLQEQSSNESGIHFQSKVAQAQIAMQIPQKFLKGVWHQIGEAYFAACKAHYTYPMTFQSRRIGVKFYLNVPGGIQMEEISRLNVIINQSPNSESYRRQLLQQYVSLSQYLPDPATKMALARLVMQSLPGVPDEDLAKLSEVAKLSEDYQKLLLQYQTQNLQMGMMQQQQQAQQMMAPQGMGGMPGGGAPPQGPQGPQGPSGGMMPHPPQGVTTAGGTGSTPPPPGALLNAADPHGFAAALPQHHGQNVPLAGR